MGKNKLWRTGFSMTYRHEWAPVPFNGTTIYMSRDAYQEQINGKWVRTYRTQREHKELAARLGARLPTAAELDARWLAAELHNLPHTYPSDLPKYQNTHSAAIDNDIPEGYTGIVGNVGKHWILESSQPMPSKAVKPLYGWHWDHPYWPPGHYIAPLHPAVTPGLYVIQRPWDSAHTEGHFGYSMTGVYTKIDGCSESGPPSEGPTDVTPVQLTPPPMSRPGSPAAVVRLWRAWLTDQGYDVDGVGDTHGPKTQKATLDWLAGLPLGIDVSEHQIPKRFNWPALAKRVKFVIARACYGTRRDRAFAEFVARAMDHGIQVGAYIFFRQTQSGRDQARALTDAMRDVGMGPGCLCPWVDLEDNRAYDGAVQPVLYRREGQALIDDLRASWGECGAYLAPYFWPLLGRPAWLGERPIWSAHWDVPRPAWPDNPALWQFDVDPLPEYMGGGAPLDQNRALWVPTLR